MGNCFSSAATSANSAAVPGDKERSYAIDKQIDDDAKKFRRECKILLLG
jgi:guanine nucleotide-binding protein G(i) subunit alpha